MQRRDPAQWSHPSISTPQDLVDRKYNAEATIREQKAKLSGLEDEHGRARQELQRLRVDNARLDSGHHEHEKCINQMRTRVAVLEQEVKDKEELLEKTAAMCQSEKEQKVVWRGCSSIHGCLIHNHSFSHCYVHCSGLHMSHVSLSFQLLSLSGRTVSSQYSLLDRLGLPLPRLPSRLPSIVLSRRS